jgi:hypothetical protein
VARPLTAFNWAEAARSALVTSKHLFTVAPILVYFHPEKPTVVETDASDFALGAVLSQIQETKRLHLVAYHSRKFKPAEINYYVCYNETFKEWVHMPQAVTGEITVYTIRIAVFCYHKSLDQTASALVRAPRRVTLRWYTDPARSTQKPMCYLGVGTTPLKRGAKPPQSAFSRLFRSPSGSDGFRSPSRSDEKRRRRPSGFDGQDCRDSERGIRGYRRWNRGLKLDVHSCGKRDGTL